MIPETLDEVSLSRLRSLKAAAGTLLENRELLAPDIAGGLEFFSGSVADEIELKDKTLREAAPGLDRNAPLYMQIADYARREIRAGRLEGAVPVKSLGDLFGCARQTAARGLVALEDEGYVKRHPGVGYAVTYKEAR